MTLIQINELYPGCIIVKHDAELCGCYPPRCECGCGISGLQWALHHTRDVCEDANHYEYFEVVRKAISKEPMHSRVMDGWLVRKVAGDPSICGGHGAFHCTVCFTEEQLERMTKAKNAIRVTES